MISHGSSFLVHTARVGCVLAMIFAVIPTEPDWMDRGDVKQLEHPLPSIGSNARYSLQVFTGGDGVTNLVGRLHLPTMIDSEQQQQVGNSSALPPVVVMAHGLGLVQDAKLTSFVDAYVQEGIAVMTFDYATCGWSEGWPRHKVIPSRQVADCKAAVAHVRTKLAHKVNIHQISLWGFSLAGGHVLSVAASDPDIKAVVSLMPHVKSGLEGVVGTIINDPILGTLRLVKVGGALLKWLMSELMELVLPGRIGTTYIPLHGKPGSVAVLQNVGDDEGYGRLVNDLPSSLKWTNRVSVSSVLPILFYRPLNVVHQISSPTLLFAGEKDALCPSDAVQAAMAKMDPHKTRLVLLKNATHFDIYNGELLQRVLQESRDFLVATLFSNGDTTT